MSAERSTGGGVVDAVGPRVARFGEVDLVFGTGPISVEEYREDRIAELGEFIGTVIAGIYEGIRNGEADYPSNYAEAAGRDHVSWSAYFADLAEQRPTTER